MHLLKKITFWNYVLKTDTCWLWTGGTQSKGYGDYGFFDTALGKHVHMLAHRFSYQLAYGDIDDGLQVHHVCEIFLCVNPEHLLAVTPLQHKGLHHGGQLVEDPDWRPPPKLSIIIPLGWKRDWWIKELRAQIEKSA